MKLSTILLVGLVAFAVIATMGNYTHKHKKSECLRSGGIYIGGRDFLCVVVPECNGNRSPSP